MLLLYPGELLGASSLIFVVKMIIKLVGHIWGGGGSVVLFCFYFVDVRPEFCAPNVTDDSGLSIRDIPLDVLYRTCSVAIYFLPLT
jgi:hypothetical protein